MEDEGNEPNLSMPEMAKSVLHAYVDDYFRNNNMDSQGELLTKEVFARFGLAYYESEVLHRGLCHIYVFCTFASKTDITSPRVEEKFAHAYSLTLGSVNDKIQSIIPEDLKLIFDQAVEKRNYLAHHFWFERAEKFLSDSGKKEMIEELTGYTELFSKADEMADQILEPKLKEFGFSDADFQIALEEIKKGKAMEPFPNIRKLKKQERITHVWEVVLPSGGNTIVFETDDGCLWQLCDVGFGWTNQIKNKNWTEYQKTLKYLPANINPRPSKSNPWQYEFKLSKNVVFCVNPGSKPGTCKWGIKNI